MRAYLDILAVPGALRFSLAGLLARANGAMTGIGLVLMVSTLYGGYAIAGALVAANTIAWAAGTAVLSNLVDRLGQRRVMYPAAMVAATALAAVVILASLGAPVWTLFAPVIVAGFTSGSPGAMVRARWSYLLREADPRLLHTAYSLESTFDEVTFVVGPVIATALATGVHPTAALVAAFITIVAGAVLFYSQRSTEPPTIARDSTGSQRRFILFAPGMAAVVLVNLLIGCLFGGIDISVIAATTEWGVRQTAGLVLAAFSGASALAGLLYGARHWKRSLTWRFVVGVVAMLLTSLGLFWVDSVPGLVLVGVLVGLTVAPSLICGNSLIGHLVPASRLTEGLSWMGSGIGIGAALGSSLTGSIVDHSGYHWGFSAVVGFAGVAALIAVLSATGLRRAQDSLLEPADPVTDDPAPEDPSRLDWR